MIEALIVADETRKTLRQKTKSGRLPLHIAVSNKLSSAIIKLLLDEEMGIELQVDKNSDIYQMYRGYLPVHIASGNHSSVETVAMLLEKDHMNYALTSYNGSVEYDSVSFAFDTDSTKDVFCRRYPVPLHLAIASGSTEIASLFLQKEKELHDQDNKLRIKAIFCKDLRGRLPLHLACISNSHPDIVKTLLELDSKDLTVYEKDDDGLMPIHYICGHKNLHLESLSKLLEMKDGLYWKDITTHHIYKNEQSLLLIAMNAGVCIQGIEILMHPRVFYTNGIKGLKRIELAEMVKQSPILQQYIVTQISITGSFFLLTSRLYVNFASCILFFVATEDLISGTVTPLYVTLLLVW